MTIRMISIELAVAVVVFSVLLALRCSFDRAAIPSHLIGHPAFVIPNIISEDASEKLNWALRDLKNYYTNINADLKSGYVGAVEHIGEAVPLPPGGRCKHSLMVPNLQNTHCILPQRVDVAAHFIGTGGPQAIRESAEEMTARVMSFAVYSTGEGAFKKYPVIGELFSNKTFTDSAKVICPKDKQLLDPFQFTFLLQLPGQSVATHLDAPYFVGANRKFVPQWLLASMTFSNLFADKYVNQVQVVTYLHKWSPIEEQKKADRERKPGAPRKEIGGDFIYYSSTDGAMELLTAEPNSGNLVDGSKVVHAATIYRPFEPAPPLDKGRVQLLRYVGNETWNLIDETDGHDVVLRTYSTNDLRISLVYRARCYADEEERLKVMNAPPMSIESILDVFIKDLIKKGRLTEDKAKVISRIDLAELIMKVYVKYPFPSVEQAPYMPFNYCALPSLFPWTKSIISLLC